MYVVGGLVPSKCSRPGSSEVLISELCATFDVYALDLSLDECKWRYLPSSGCVPPPLYSHSLTSFKGPHKQPGSNNVEDYILLVGGSSAVTVIQYTHMYVHAASFSSYWLLLFLYLFLCSNFLSFLLNAVLLT